MRINYSSRFFLYAPICLFLGLAVLVMAHWWIVTGAFERKLAVLKGHAAMPGVTLDWSSVAIGGFPFRVDATFTGFTARGRGPHGPFAWTSGGFALHFLTYGRTQDVFEASGRQSLGWTGGDGVHHAIRFLPGAIQASAVTDGRGLARFDLRVIDAGSADFTAADLQLHLRRAPDHKSIDLMARADDVRTKTEMSLFGGGLKTLRLYVTLNDEAAFAGLLNGTAPWPDAIDNWRARGGRPKVGAVQVQSALLNTRMAGDARLNSLLDPLY